MGRAGRTSPSTRRAAPLAAAVAVGTLLVGASFAWACTSFMRIDAVVPATDAPVATASVRGSGATANALVQVRFNADTGPVIGAAPAGADGAFDVAATLPADISAGVYTLIASDGQTQVGRMALELGASPSGAPDLVSQVKASHGLASTSPASPVSPALFVVVGAGVLLLGSTLAVTTVKRRKALATR